MGYKNNDPCLEKVKDDEPIFVLRARDESAATLVWLWAALNDLPGDDFFYAKSSVSKLAHDLISSLPAGHQSPTKITEAKAWAQTMGEYPEKRRAD